MALVLGILAGVAVRAWVDASPIGSLDSDEAVWGLMASWTLDGHFATFFWHQTYGGTQEVLLLAPIFAVTGPSVVAIRVVQTLLYALAALLVWRIGRRTVGEPAARIGAVVFWVWPAYLVWRSSREYGFYASGLLFSLLALLLVLRLDERRSPVDLVLLGLVLGQGWWATPMVAVVAVPALVWLVIRSPRRLRDVPLVATAAVVGGLPWFVWNLEHGWRSLKPTAGNDTYADHLVTFVSANLPALVGARLPWSLEWPAGEVAGRIATVAVAAVVAWLALRHRRGRVGLLLLCTAAYPFLHALNPLAWIPEDPKYLTFLAPLLALLFAYAAVTARVAWLAVPLALLVTVGSLVPIERHRLPMPSEGGKRIPADLSPALDALERVHANRVLAMFWIAYRITFESRERIVATSSSGNVRYDAQDRLVRRSPHPARVFVAGSAVERAARSALERAGYRRIVRGGWAIYL